MEAQVVFFKYKLPSAPCPERPHQIPFPCLSSVALDKQDFEIRFCPN